MLKMFSRLNSKSGMSLVEIMIVLVIMGMIVGLVGRNVMSSLKKSKVNTTTLQMKNFQASLLVSPLVLDRFGLLCCAESIPCIQNASQSTDSGIGDMQEISAVSPVLLVVERLHVVRFFLIQTFQSF